MNPLYKLYLYKALRTPPHKTVMKALHMARRKGRDKWNRYKDLYRQRTYMNDPLYAIDYSYININNLNLSGLDRMEANFLSEMYMEHRFDLLGSGWIKVNYNLNPLGLEGIKYDMSPGIEEFDIEGQWMSRFLRQEHLEVSRNIWCQINAGYEPIDWQIDYKSGYRWDASKWYKEQPTGAKPGVDIKVPWELSRLQHLPQMAVFAYLLPEKKRRLVIEFRNQVLDFISANPVNMGVNWNCTMDVGIRAANLLTAYDMFKQLDSDHLLDSTFEKILFSSIYQHGVFIVNNFEWSELLTSNHYLANICGLLFISAYLECSSITDAWLAFSLQELIEEMRKQFHDDGSNFEASTSYHRLSGEMVIYSAALALGVVKKKTTALQKYNHKLVPRLRSRGKDDYNKSPEGYFPHWFVERLGRTGLFTVDITKPSGEIVQVGDNDSGRFLKFSPSGEFLTKFEADQKYYQLKGYSELSNIPNQYWDENMIDHSTFVSAISGLFAHNKFEEYKMKYPFESSVVTSLSDGTKYNISLDRSILNAPTNHLVEFPILQHHEATRISDICAKEEELDLIVYPDFGLYIYRSSDFLLSIMAGGNGQLGNAGHTHNDKLSFEIYADGNTQYVDPGTYVYSALPARRNQFRCTASHNTIFIEGTEQNDYLTLFAMKDETRCHVLESDRSLFKAHVRYKNVHHIRTIRLMREGIEIIDQCNVPFHVGLNRGTWFSNGYGKLIVTN